jgi:hypothetical protein
MYPKSAKCCLSKQSKPLTASPCLCKIRKINKKRKRKSSTITDKQRSTRDGWIVSVVYAIYLLYPILIVNSFMTFQCIDICGQNYLVLDDKEECFGSNVRHTLFAFLVALPTLLIFGIALPLTLFMFLHAKRSFLYTSPTIVFRYGLLYSGYSSTRWWWEITALFKKVVLISIVTFGCNDTFQVHIALGFMICLMFFQEREKPYKDVNVREMESTIDKKKKQHAPLHNMEIWSFLLSIMIMWFAVYFINNPPTRDEDCHAITNEESCNDEDSPCRWIGGGNGDDGKSLPKCVSSPIAKNILFTVATIGSNIVFIIICMCYFARSFAVRKNFNLGDAFDKIKAIRDRISFSKRRETASCRDEIEMTENSAVTEVKHNVWKENPLNSHSIHIA